jgi:hypothetical protein
MGAGECGFGLKRCALPRDGHRREVAGLCRTSSGYWPASNDWNCLSSGRLRSDIAQ